MFRKPVLFPLSDNEVLNLVDPLKGEIHNHWVFFFKFYSTDKVKEKKKETGSVNGYGSNFI